MGNETTKLTVENARLEERSKSLKEAADKEKEYTEYLKTLQKERREERIAEQAKTEEAAKAYKAILEKENKRLEAEREEGDKRKREEQQKQLKEQQNREERKRKELKKPLEEQQTIEELKEQLEEQQKREERISEELKKHLQEQHNIEELKEQLEEQQKREERIREELNKYKEEHKVFEQQLAQQKAKEKIEEDLRKEIDRRRKRVNTLKPGSTLKFHNLVFPKCLNIGFFGTTGVGKTSLMNSLMFAIEGKLDETSMEQVFTDDYQGGHTVRRLRIVVSKEIALIDNRGVGEEDLYSKAADMELIRQLEGRGSFVDKVNWRSAKPLEKKETEGHRIYCAVVVLDARKAQSYYKVVNKYASTLKEWLGCFPISVITNVDRADQGDLENLHLILRSAGISDYYDVENVRKDSKMLKEKYQLSLLKMMERCFKDGDRIFEFRSKLEGEQNKK